MVTETNNPSETTLTVVKDEETAVDNANNAEITGQSDARALSPYEKAEIGLKEICEKYGIREFHIAKMISDEMKKKTDMLKNESLMFQQNKLAMTGKVEWKEMIVREIHADAQIDKHNQEMQQYERNVIDTVVGWLNTNKSEAANEMVQIMCAELGLPYAQIVNKLQDKVNSYAYSLFQDKMNDEITLQEKKIQEEIKQAILRYSKMSKKEQKAYLANLSK